MLVAELSYRSPYWVTLVLRRFMASLTINYLNNLQHYSGTLVNLPTV